MNYGEYLEKEAKQNSLINSYDPDWYHKPSKPMKWGPVNREWGPMNSNINIPDDADIELMDESNGHWYMINDRKNKQRYVYDTERGGGTIKPLSSSEERKFVNKGILNREASVMDYNEYLEKEASIGTAIKSVGGNIAKGFNTVKNNYTGATLNRVQNVNSRRLQNANGKYNDALNAMKGSNISNPGYSDLIANHNSAVKYKNSVTKGAVNRENTAIRNMKNTRNAVHGTAALGAGAIGVGAYNQHQNQTKQAYEVVDFAFDKVAGAMQPNALSKAVNKPGKLKKALGIGAGIAGVGVAGGAGAYAYNKKKKEDAEKQASEPIDVVFDMVPHAGKSGRLKKALKSGAMGGLGAGAIGAGIKAYNKKKKEEKVAFEKEAGGLEDVGGFAYQVHKGKKLMDPLMKKKLMYAGAGALGLGGAVGGTVAGAMHNDKKFKEKGYTGKSNYNPGSAKSRNKDTSTRFGRDVIQPKLKENIKANTAGAMGGLLAGGALGLGISKGLPRAAKKGNPLAISALKGDQKAIAMLGLGAMGGMSAAGEVAEKATRYNNKMNRYNELDDKHNVGMSQGKKRLYSALSPLTPEHHVQMARRKAEREAGK